MTIVQFEQIKVTAQKRFDCSRCGKQCQRTRSFAQTLNPFNKNADGTVKDRQTINIQIRDEAKAWLAAPGMCVVCEREDREQEDDEDDEDDED